MKKAIKRYCPRGLRGGQKLAWENSSTEAPFFSRMSYLFCFGTFICSNKLLFKLVDTIRDENFLIRKFFFWKFSYPELGSRKLEVIFIIRKSEVGSRFFSQKFKNSKRKDHKIRKNRWKISFWLKKIIFYVLLDHFSKYFCHIYSS